MSGARWLTTAEVLDRLKLSKPTLYRMIKQERFPKPKHPGRWLASEVEAALTGGNVNAEEPREGGSWNFDRAELDAALKEDGRQGRAAKRAAREVSALKERLKPK